MGKIEYFKIGGHGVDEGVKLLEVLGNIDRWMELQQHEVLIGYDTDEKFIVDIKVYTSGELVYEWSSYK
jgi:hypothetical protein